MAKFQWDLTEPELDDIRQALQFARERHEHWLASSPNHSQAAHIQIQCDRWRSRESDLLNVLNFGCAA